MKEFCKSAAAYVCRRRIWTPVLIGLAVCFAGIYVRGVLRAPVNHDEVEHLHVAYKIWNGGIPYRDFYQNHWPIHWLLCMLCVKAFPFSVNAILAGRILNLLMLGGCWLLGLRLLRGIRGGRTWFSLAVYSYVMILLAHNTYWGLVRPDPFMALMATAGLCAIPLQGSLSHKRALLSGFLFGLSVAISAKTIPMLLIVPALIGIRYVRDRRNESLVSVISYSLGVFLSFLPLALWLANHGLWQAFYFDVFELNRAMSRPWWYFFKMFRFTICPIALSGLWLLWRTRACRLSLKENVPLILMLSLAAGTIMFFIARHKAAYNRQALIIPLAVGFASVFLYLRLRLRSRNYRLPACALLLAVSMRNVGHIKLLPQEVPLPAMQEIIGLAKPGGKTCTAFSPSHPLFCRDVSGLSNGWDLNFPQNIHDPRQIARFRRLWHEGIQRTIEQQPDIILRKAYRNIWELAAVNKLVAWDDIKALDRIQSAYDVRKIGVYEFWIKRTQGRNDFTRGNDTGNPGSIDAPGMFGHQ